MDSDQWKNRPTRMRVEYVDGGESSIDSLNSHDPNSSGEDGSPNSLPELYEPHIPPYDLLGRTKTMRPPSISSSSSATTTSSGELFQMIPQKVIKSPGKEETSSEVAPTTTEVVSDHVIVLGASPTQSPPVQVMNRSSEAAHDPYRIPAATFETSNSIADVDWSNGSNDSLFSIRIGNASFMKDRTGNAWCRESVRPKKALTFTPDRWSMPPSPPSEEVAPDDKLVRSPEDRTTKQFEEIPTVVEKKETKEYRTIEEPKVIHPESLNLSNKNDEIEASPKHYSFSA